MNKKLLGALLLGALTVTSTGTLVSCKDYDDDITHLQDQVDELSSLKAAKTDVEASIADLKTQLEAKVAEANTAVGAEKDRAVAAEAALAARLTTAESALSELQDLINNKVDKSEFNEKVQDIYAKLESVQTDLGSALTKITELKQGLKDEETARKAADADLKQQIEALETALKSADAANEAQIEALKTAVQALQSKTADLDVAGLKAELKALSDKIDAISADLNTLNVLVKASLRSLVFEPESYYWGIEATKILSLDYIKYFQDANKNGKLDANESFPAAAYDKVEPVGYDNHDRYATVEGSKVLDFTASYHLNPSNASAESFKAVKILDADKDYINTRSSAAGLSVKNWNVANGMLNVDIQANDSRLIKSVPNDKQVTVFATQVTLGTGAADTTITSDYATLYRDAVSTLKLAHRNANDVPFLNVENTHESCGVATSHKHLMQTANEAKADFAPQDYINYKDETLDLRKLVETHYTDVDGKEKVLDITKYGLEYKFELTGLYYGNNKTSESAHAAIAADGYTLRAQLPEKETGKQQAYGAEQGRAEIGRTPLVRVSLVDSETGAVYDYGYIRIKITEKATPAPADKHVDYTGKGYTYNGECQAAGWSMETKWIQTEYDLYTELGMTREEFEANYSTSPVKNGAVLQQYTYNEKTQKFEKSTVDYGTVTNRNDASSEDGTLTSTLKWNMTSADAYKFFVTEKKTAISVAVKYESANKDKYPDVYVQFHTGAPITINTPSAKIDWAPIKNSNYWYASNTSTAGGDEIHNNVLTPEDNAAGKGNSMVQTLSAVMEGNDIAATKIIKDIQDLTSGKEYAANKLTLNLVFSSKNTGAEFKGHDGNTYVLSVANNGKDLQANIKGQTAKQTIATISNDPDVNKQTITYVRTSTYAQALLNYVAHNELADDVIKALVTVEATNKCPRILALDGETFAVRFLRPINVFSADKAIEDANVEKIQTIKLHDMVKFTDWRDAWKGESYCTYYGITNIEVDGVANGAYLSTSDAVKTNQNGSNFEPLKKINSMLDFQYNAGTGHDDATITYKNFNSTVQKFQVKIPVVVTYFWGKIKTNVIITVDGTAGNK